jgi:hypothetical protein
MVTAVHREFDNNGVSNSLALMRSELVENDSGNYVYCDSPTTAFAA